MTYIQHPIYPAGYQQIQLVEATGQSITPPSGASKVIIRPNGYDIRVRDDNVMPTATVGFRITKETTLELETTLGLNALKIAPVANDGAGAPATGVLHSGPVNSDITFTSIADGTIYNGTNFATVEDAVAGVNATAVLGSGPVNSDLTFTADSQTIDHNDVNFATVNDATVGVKAHADILSGPVNSDLIATAAVNGVAFNDVNFSLVADASVGVQAHVHVNSVAVNSDMTFTAVANGVAFNDVNFTVVNDVVAAANATATLLSGPVNSDITFTATTVGSVNNGVNFASVNDVTAGTSANATLDCLAVNADLVFTAPAVGTVHNGIQFNTISGVAESITYANGVFDLTFNHGTSNGSTLKATFDAAIIANPAWPAWTVAVEGDGSGLIDDAITPTSANGTDAVAQEITYAAPTFTIHFEGGVTTANDIEALWVDANSPAECANWVCAKEGAGLGLIDADTDTSANGVDAVVEAITYAAPTFTIHVDGATTSANDIAALWVDVNAPAECANWTCAEQGDGTGIVDAGGPNTSAGGVENIPLFISYAAPLYTVHIIAATTTAAAIVAEWTANGSADWVLTNEGDGTGLVDAGGPFTSAGGVNNVPIYISYAAPTFTLHIIGTVTTAADLKALWVAPGAPAECAVWALEDEGDGTGVVSAATATSAGGVVAVPISIDYVSPLFTIHTIPAVTTAAQVAALWVAGGHPADCEDWTCAAEGDGSGVVSADTATSAGGLLDLGALVDLLWYRENDWS